MYLMILKLLTIKPSCDVGVSWDVAYLAIGYIKIIHGASIGSGRSGLEAKLEYRFPERFGAVLLRPSIIN